MLVLLYLIANLAKLSEANSQARRLPIILSREDTLNNIRIQISPLEGHFPHPDSRVIEEKLAPAVSGFYSHALKIYRLVYPLTPEIDACGPYMIPEHHKSIGAHADVLIYIGLASKLQVEISEYKICELDGGTFARPLVGIVEIHPYNFFKLPESRQIQLLIREVGSILAFSKENFEKFVKKDGSMYSHSQYLTYINYPERGKTVSAIAFPKMLEKARAAFNCSLVGLELEDYYEDDQKLSHWDARVMPHDIMSSILSDEPVFSDISLAVFEDSGWYEVDYSYSSSIYMGKHQGCAWHSKKCVVGGLSQLPGFCDKDTPRSSCDALNLGYGDCLISEHKNLPSHFSYFPMLSVGGSPLLDYCPIVYIAEDKNCRDPNGRAEVYIGETRGPDSRCLMNTLISHSLTDNATEKRGGCYKINSCGENSVNVTVGGVSVECTYGKSVAVRGFNGLLECPESNKFCFDLPCPNLCNGKGKCIKGKCECNSRWQGIDCSYMCEESCSKCIEDVPGCLECFDGHFLVDKVCYQCDPRCKTCDGSANKCTSCHKNSLLVEGTCKENCLTNCATCKSPCDVCSKGYYLLTTVCAPCNHPCAECEGLQSKCTSCISGYNFINGDCVPDCIEGCSTCDVPCSDCITGFALESTTCTKCSNLCKSCSSRSNSCTSCFPGYVLTGNSCIQGCLPNCQSCDQPCTQCEEGYLSVQGRCLECSNDCLTCEGSVGYCTKCYAGFEPINGECQAKCIDHCKTCDYPCETCESGYYQDMGSCEACDDRCATCWQSAMFCTTCKPGFGLIGGKCEEGCTNHCASCDVPCGRCENGYFSYGNDCSKCDASCESCEKHPKHCTVCASGYMRSGQICIEGCNDNCLSCDEPCSNCAIGYYSYKYSCSDCSENCLTCEEDPDKCTSCNEGFGLVESTCKKGCLDHCVSCDANCSVCESGYYLNSETMKCDKCLHGCKTCKNTAIECLDCIEGYTFEDGYCNWKCMENCLSCDLPCTVCNVGFTPVGKECKRCAEGCNTCSSALDHCYTCQNGYFLEGNQCKKVCIPHCTTCDSPCQDCQSGYALVKGVCVKCSLPCVTCEGSSTTCLSCPENFSLENSTCNYECVHGCTDCNKPCQKCKEGFLLQSGTCDPCDSLCSECLTSPSHCTSCVAGYLLSGNQCKPDCIQGCSSCEIPCTQCNHGFKLLQGYCSPCNHYFTESDLTAKYIEDFTRIEVLVDGQMLNHTHNCQALFLPSTIIKFGTDPGCYWESPEKLLVTLGKNASHLIDKLEMYPLLSIGERCDTVPEVVTIKVDIKESLYPIVSISAPNSYSLSCKAGMLTIQGIAEEDVWGYLVSTSPKLQKLEDYILSIKSKTLLVPDDYLNETSLNITFFTTNNIGKTSYTSKVITINNEKKMELSIDVGNYLRIQSGKSYMVRANVAQTDCVLYGHLSFKWMFLSSSSQEDFDSDTIVTQSRLNYNLVIYSGQLKAGNTYDFRVEAHDTHSVSFSDVKIDVIASDLVIVLDRSDGDADINERLTISARDSYDPDSADTKLSFVWSCLNGVHECYDSHNKTLMSVHKSPVLTIPAKRIPFNETLEFKVKVTAGHRTSVKSIFIKGSYTASYIQIPSVSTTVNVKHDFVIFPQYVYSNGILDFVWTQILGPIVQPSTPFHSDILVIPAYEMMQGSGYSFMVTMTVDNDSTSTVVSWLTNAGPWCSELTALVVSDVVTVYIDCYDADYNDFPLRFIYGVVLNDEYSPLRILHSSVTSFVLNSGKWNLYVEVCDTRHTCLRKETVVEIKGRKLEEGFNRYTYEKMLPDNIPTAILNNVGGFNRDNFDIAFADLVGYIKSHWTDRAHLDMAITSLELLTASNRSHFYWHHQEDILRFLGGIVENLEFIGDEEMGYLVELLSEHKVKNYELANQIISLFSYKWMMSQPLGTLKEMKKNIHVLRHRVLRSFYKEYKVGGLRITNINPDIMQDHIYDLIIIVYESKPSPILSVQVMLEGNQISHSYSFYKEKPVKSELPEPITVEFRLEHDINVDCLQLHGNEWIQSGCKVYNTSDTLVKYEFWHLDTYKLIASDTVKIGYTAIFTEAVMIFLCVLLVAAFCAIDKSKSNYIQTPFYQEVKQAEPVSPENVVGSEEPKKKFDFENKVESITPIASVEITIPKVGYWIYHPYFNMNISQNGDRRAASCLHMFAVLFAEFICCAILVNYRLKRIFNDQGEYIGLGAGQIIGFTVGMIFTQAMSFGLMILNQVNDITITKKYLGMAISLLFIFICSIVGLIFATSFPHIYSKWWTIAFIATVFIELSVFQTIWFLVNCRIFRKRTIENIVTEARGLRVFTTET